MLTETGHLERVLWCEFVKEPSAGFFQGFQATFEIGRDGVPRLAPEVFDRVVFGRALRQEDRLDALMLSEHLLDGLRGLPPGAVPHQQNGTLDLCEHLLQEGLRVRGLALRISLGDRLSACDIERAIETKLVVAPRHVHAPLLTNGHPHSPERREALEVGLVLKKDGRIVRAGRSQCIGEHPSAA